MTERSFGARFLDELRRLTKSSWHLDYATLNRLGQMDRAQFTAAIGKRGRLIDPGWVPSGSAMEPEELAQAVVREAMRRQEVSRLSPELDVLELGELFSGILD
jgi:hypothetical protein